MIMRARLLISGSVQGVNFRWFVQETAKGMGVNGWVKNLPDGKVEIECESETEKSLREFMRTIEDSSAAKAKGFNSILVEGVQVLSIGKGAAPKYDYFNIEY
ncbi:acylphosphatase [Candidatus Micrarchaeota archaeon]|nr:acylphosphatase [Candidatus Micrarchaeota archaeon]